MNGLTILVLLIVATPETLATIATAVDVTTTETETGTTIAGAMMIGVTTTGGIEQFDFLFIC